jgi:hypothetical protein
MLLLECVRVWVWEGGSGGGGGEERKGQRERESWVCESAQVEWERDEYLHGHMLAVFNCLEG